MCRSPPAPRGGENETDSRSDKAMTSSDASIPATASPRLSVVVPAYNEEENVVPLAREIVAALEGLPGGFELILVDDASTDATARLIREFGDARVRGVFHRINCGQSAAVASGFRAARGAWVGTLDGDGQNDPADLPAMLEQAIAEGVDCVTGVRRQRQDTFIRRISSKIANGYRNWITGDRVSDSGCGIRVARRAALCEIPVFNGMHRFLPTLLRGQGFSVVERAVNHRERLRGTSKYGVHNRLWRGIRDCFGIRWYLSRAVRSERIAAQEK